VVYLLFISREYVRTASTLRLTTSLPNTDEPASSQHGCWHGYEHNDGPPEYADGSTNESTNDDYGRTHDASDDDAAATGSHRHYF
jgi:hypothetical protein